MLFQVTLSCAVEHPFYVFEQGWASCVPDKSLQTFGLVCNPLKVGDVCIFLSPNAIQIPVSMSPQGQLVSSPRLPVPSAPVNKPVQNIQTSPQTQHVVDNHQNTAPLPANAVVIKQSAPAAEATSTSQGTSLAQPPSSAVMTVTSSALPPGGALVFDPQLGVLRSPGLGNQFLNQQVIGTMMDGKTVSLQGNLPPYYQTVPASLVGSIPSQSVVQSPSIQGQAGIGNGLVLTAVGLVPGMNQPGMVYASQLSEIAQKQGLETIETNSGASENPSQSDTGAPGAKRPKVDGQ